MGPVYKVEGEPIHILEGDVVKVIFQCCVCSSVKSLAESSGIVAAGVQPPAKNYQTLSDLRKLGNLQIVKSVSEHVDRVTNKVNVRHISQVLLAGV